MGDNITEATAEICNQCGRSVKRGSGWFVNRVPSDFGGVEAAMKAGTPFPTGAWQCSACGNNEDIFSGALVYSRIEALDMIADQLDRIPTPDEADECIGFIATDAETKERFNELVKERIAAWISERMGQA